MKFQFKSISTPSHLSKEWPSWKWQLKNLNYPWSKATSPFFLTGATPYYLKLIEESFESNLKDIVKVHPKEFQPQEQDLEDPLAEKAHSPTNRIIHRYPDRVLFLVTDTCGVYCRYCTRKYFTGKKEALIKQSSYLQALDYIKKQEGIREVILSGGDPLTLSDSILERILKDLRSIDHIEILRIASRMPVVCPMRLTPSLLRMLKKFNPLFLLTHFNHPSEITKQAAQALEKTVDSGLLVFNQTVLLNGVNNHPILIQALLRRLLYLRVKPYYLFQCDPSKGSGHFKTSIENSQWIQRELWGRLSGLALPSLSLDIPNGGGKVSLVPDFFIEKEDNKWTYQGWDHVTDTYISPKEKMKEPPDLKTYTKEWLLLKNQTYGRENPL